MKKTAVLWLLGVVALLACMQGCNTVKGMGQDIEKGGQEIEETAEDVKN